MRAPGMRVCVPRVPAGTGVRVRVAGRGAKGQRSRGGFTPPGLWPRVPLSSNPSGTAASTRPAPPGGLPSTDLPPSTPAPLPRRSPQPLPGPRGKDSLQPPCGAGGPATPRLTRPAEGWGSVVLRGAQSCILMWEPSSSPG